jgi:MFS superfamily sulfate permease-like transporter
MACMKFTLREFSGSLADLGTAIPFILIAVAVSGMRPGPIMLMFGLLYVYSGFIYRIPMPVQPMKAIGTVVVAAGLTQGEVVGAGLFMGMALLLLGLTGAIGYLERIFPRSLVRGVQLGLALVLLTKGGAYVLKDLHVGAFALIFLAAAILWNGRHKDIYLPGALAVLTLGTAYGVYRMGVPALQLSLPLNFYIPTPGEFLSGAYKAAVPQLPLTLTNSVLATSLLASDLFKAKVPSKRLSANMGLANLILTPMGGFPMCHGSGGMAAHYRFGARTGGAGLMIGLLFVALAFVSTPSVLGLVPVGVFGALLAFAGLELMANAFNTDMVLVTSSTGVASLFVDPTIGLLAGVAVYLALRIVKVDKSSDRIMASLKRLLAGARRSPD